MIYTFGDYELDVDAHELRRGQTLVHVEPQVFDVLAYLLEHPTIADHGATATSAARGSSALPSTATAACAPATATSTAPASCRSRSCWTPCGARRSSPKPP